MGRLIRIARLGERFKVLIVPLFFFVGAAFAQTGLYCNPTSVAVLLRSEGLTERVGDIVLNCSGGAPGAMLKSNLTVFLNVNVTNRLAGNSFTDVLLTVDTGSGPVPANASAQPYAANAVVFNGVSFTVPASGQVTLRVTNLRADANQAGRGSQLPIIAYLSVSGTTDLTVSSVQFIVGITQPGLLATFSSDGVTCTGSLLPGIINLSNLFAVGTHFFSTRVTEGFASAFQAKDPFSDTGTRIMVSYSGFPAGARLFVPDFIAGSSALQPTAGGDLGLAASGGQYAPGAGGSLLLIRVTGADQNGAGGTLAFPTPSMGVASFNSASEIALSNGSGNAVFEVVNSNPSARESAQFPTFLGLAPFGSGTATVAQMAVSFAPIASWDTASSAAPIPRFVDVTPPSDCTALGDCNAAYFPHLEVDAPPLEFTAPVNAFLQTAYVRVHNNGGGLLDWTATVAYQTGSGWLTADPESGPDNATIRVDAHPDKVPPGVYQATLTVDAGPLAGSHSIPVTFTVTNGLGSVGPAISSIVNAASLQAGPVVAGSLATIMGLNMSGSNIGVTFDGSPAKLLYTSSTLINLQVPGVVAGKTSSQVVVTVDGQSSAPQTAALAVVAPAIFNPGILNQDHSVNSTSKPASTDSIVRIYATGLASPGSGAITARIAGRDISPHYAGPATGIPGVQWVDLAVPADLPSGATQVEVCAIGTNPAQPVCSLPATLSLK
jgi:uncharacterized protein (TIGR03437 family)